ncbi:hypothetical protein EAX62_11260 [Tessaracoccus antarcticus]|uniref:Uncharacterized protein n=2 Tax=Tessaracoccus antarcticus TaxID=2479848 RepID=A0A3M0G173_9ACTN|nr:hypothetical protein EAX62_11260 [Tessaracoccus antarcticus]
MSLSPALDPYRLPPSERCWWCDDKATTEEHRFKLSTLRRVARADTGQEDPRTVFKKSDDWEGLLRSIRKGAQVRWRKNMCAKCNNQRSQPFDLAYDTMEAFIVTHADDMMKWSRLSWADVYGAQWQQGAADLARYFGKQLGCMLATQRLPVPAELIGFLNGAKRCPPIAFMILRNWRAGDMHRTMLRDGFDDGITNFVGLLPATAYSREERFSAVDYVYHIGYVWFCVNWTEETDRSSWWEHDTIDMPMVNGELLSRLNWRILSVRERLRRARRRDQPT